MNNQLMKFEDMRSMSDIFFQSKVFKDLPSAAMALVKIQAGQELGVAPFAAMSGIYIIQGRPTVGAAIIASKIKASPKYNYKIKKIDDTVCSIDFYENDELTGNSQFTIEDAKKAGTQNIGKHPRNMLFARAISNGQKWYAPDVFDGPVYTPEDFNESTTPTTESTAEVMDSKPIELEIVDENHPKFDGISDGILNKGYTFADVAIKYNLTDSAKQTIQIALDEKKNVTPTKTDPIPVTQAMISEMNKTISGDPF